LERDASDEYREPGFNRLTLQQRAAQDTTYKERIPELGSLGQHISCTDLHLEVAYTGRIQAGIASVIGRFCWSKMT
jgi:hypothetical protein